MQFYEKGLEKFPLHTVVFNNILMILWIVFGFVACYFFHPIAAWSYLAFAIFMVLIVLRKLVCTNCYYFGKRCWVGWGKLSALFYKKGKVEGFSSGFGLKLAPFVYMFLIIIPLVLGLISVYQEFTWIKLTVLLLLLSVASYSGTICRKKACTNCKMSRICPMKAAKLNVV